MLYLICFVTYFISYKAFLRSEQLLFPENPPPQKAQILFAIFITLIYFLYTFYGDYKYEAFALFCIPMSYFLGFYFILKQHPYIILFRTYLVYFTLFALRMIVIASLALYNDMSIAKFLSTQDYHLSVTTKSFVLLAFFQCLFVYCFKITNTTQVLKDKKNFQFSIYMISVVFVYVSITAYLLYNSDVDDMRLTYLALKVGVCTVVGYVVSIFLNYSLSTMRLQKQKADKLTEEVLQEQKNVQLLEVEATIDSFTGFYIRDVAFNRIDHFLNDKEPFYICFIDMNELKIVNDTYGHDEGDFYILETTRVISEYFSSDTNVRYGGDEFLIIGKFHEENTHPLLQMETCAGKIHEIGKIHNKPYETSISFGLIVIKDDKDFTNLDDLIKCADEEMYLHKKSLKKERSVLSPV